MQNPDFSPAFTTKNPPRFPPSPPLLTPPSPSAPPPTPPVARCPGEAVFFPPDRSRRCELLACRRRFLVLVGVCRLFAHLHQAPAGASYAHGHCRASSVCTRLALRQQGAACVRCCLRRWLGVAGGVVRCVVDGCMYD